MHEHLKAIEILVNELYRIGHGGDKQSFEEKLYELLPEYKFTYAGTSWVIV